LRFVVVHQLDTHCNASWDHEMPEGLAVAAATSAGAYFLTKVLGPVLGEVGELVRDPLRQHRERRLLQTAQAAQELLDQRAAEPTAVPHRVLVPLIDGASLEDEAELQQRWAALLANAADPATAASVHPAYPAILRELSALEARILDAVLRTCELSGESPQRWSNWYVTNAAEQVGANDQEYDLAVQNLFRTQLLSSARTTLSFTNFSPQFQTHDPSRLTPTVLGVSFGLACWPQPPKIEDDGPDESGFRRERSVPNLHKYPMDEDLDSSVLDRLDELEAKRK
jgi:hypothetical protein